MVKRIVATILTLCIFLGMFPISSSANLVEEGYNLDYQTKDNIIFAEESDHHLEIYSKTEKKKGFAIKKYKTTIVFRVLDEEGTVVAEYTSMNDTIGQPKTLSAAMKKDDKLKDVAYYFDELLTSELQCWTVEFIGSSDAKNDPKGTAEKLEKNKNDLLSVFEKSVSTAQYNGVEKSASDIVGQASDVLIAATEAIDPVIGAILSLLKSIVELFTGEEESADEIFSSDIAQLMGKNIMSVVEGWTIAVYDSFTTVDVEVIFSFYRDKCTVYRECIIEEIVKLAK